MFEIIPNWHPIFVHFTIALLSMSSIFFVLLKVISDTPIKEHMRICAYWNLWIGTGFAVVTAIAGWFAYNSVAHDTASHEAMTNHRDWALITLSVFVLISIWSVKKYKNSRDVGFTFTFIMVMAFVLLASTGWRGGEVVYRYGLGVISLPKTEGDGHAHEHPAENNQRSNNTTDALSKSEKKAVISNPVKKDDHSNHNHKH